MQSRRQKDHRVRRRPRIFYGWYIVGASVAMNAYLSMAFFQGFQVFFLPIVREFGWSRALTSGAFSLRQLETGILAPVVGLLVDRLGPRRVILGGVLITGVGILLLSRISSLWMFYAAFAFVSIGTSGASHGVSWVAAVARWFRRLRGRALGLAMMGPVVGAPGIILVALLEEAIGWRTTLVLLGIGVLVVGVPLALVARSRPEEYGYRPDNEEAPPSRGPHSESSVPSPAVSEQPLEIGLTAREAIKTWSFWSLVLLFGAQSLGINGLMVHQIPYFENMGFSSAEAASTVAIMFAFSGVGRLGVGVLFDFVSWRLVMAVVLGAQSLAFLLLAAVSTYWQAILFAGFMGIAFGATVPARPALVGLLFGTRAFGSIQGLMQGAAVAAGVIGPIAFGWVFDTYTTYVPALIASAAITVLAVPFALSGGAASEVVADRKGLH